MSREIHATAIAAAKAGIGEVQDALSSVTDKLEEANRLVANATDGYDSGNIEANQAFTKTIACRDEINDAYALCEQAIRHLDNYLGSM